MILTTEQLPYCERRGIEAAQLEEKKVNFIEGIDKDMKMKPKILT